MVIEKIHQIYEIRMNKVMQFSTKTFLRILLSTYLIGIITSMIAFFIATLLYYIIK